MRYALLAIIAVSLAPLALASLLLNPLVFILLGPEAWRDSMRRLYPHRWQIVVSCAICALATATYMSHGY